MDIDLVINKLIRNYHIDKQTICTDDYILSTGEIDLYRMIYEDRKKYLNTTDTELKTIYLQKLIYDHLFIRDFVYAEKYINTYIDNKYADYQNYSEFLNELNNLFNDIKEKLANKEDIINFWIDALNYGWEQTVPFLKKCSEKSVFFEKSYTTENFTGPTLTAIMCGKNALDDEGFRIKQITPENAVLYNELKDLGYSVRYYGYHNYTVDKELSGDIKVARIHPSTIILWKIICDMIKSDGNGYYLSHIFAETHGPWLSPIIDGDYYEEKYLYDYVLIEDVKEAYRRMFIARQYIDTEIEFYSSLLGKNSCKIYMSDHSTGWGICEPNHLEMCHTVMMIDSRFQKSCRIKDFFCYKDYNKLIKRIIQKQQIDDTLCKNFTLIQGPCFRSKKQIAIRLNDHLFDALLISQIRGIVTDQDSFYTYGPGIEVYQKKDDPINYIKFSSCQNRIAELREMAGNKVPDFDKEPTFQYSKAVFEVYRRYKERVNSEPGIILMSDFINSISSEKVILIRGAGEHTIRMLSALGDLSNRINYIADKSCETKQLCGIPVISSDRIKEIHPDVIIISSLRYHKEMEEELKEDNLNCEIYDIYSELEKSGCSITKGYYENHYVQSDFEGVLEE